MTTHYFAADGSYGDANTLLVLDTSDWTEADWAEIDETPDEMRAFVALELSMRTRELDQPTLPGFESEV